MFSNEVIPMAVKKSTAPKGAVKKAKAAVKKVAPKRAAPTKAAPTKAAPKKAAPKKTGVKQAAPKKAGVKLTDPQKAILKQVIDTRAVGLLGTKGTAKILGTLLAKKLIKKGKKEKGQEHFRYFATKLGEKHAPVVVVVTESSAPSSL